MVVDNHHNTPREMIFESVRVRIFCFFKTHPLCYTNKMTTILFRNVMPSANSCSWWKPDTLSWVNLTWSLCLLAPGIWVMTMSIYQQIINVPALVINWCVALHSGGSPPPGSLQSWVTCCGLGHTPDESTALLPHDIYALGSQENPQGEREWTEHVRATLRSYTHIDFKQVITCILYKQQLKRPIIWLNTALVVILNNVL